MAEIERLIRENERLRTTLENISNYAERAICGVWRQKVYDMAQNGLKGVK